MGGFVAAAGEFEAAPETHLHVVAPPEDVTGEDAAIIAFERARVQASSVDSTIYAW